MQRIVVATKSKTWLGWNDGKGGAKEKVLMQMIKLQSKKVIMEK